MARLSWLRFRRKNPFDRALDAAKNAAHNMNEYLEGHSIIPEQKAQIVASLSVDERRLAELVRIVEDQLTVVGKLKSKKKTFVKDQQSAKIALLAYRQAQLAEAEQIAEDVVQTKLQTDADREAFEVYQQLFAETNQQETIDGAEFEAVHADYTDTGLTVPLLETLETNLAKQLQILAKLSRSYSIEAFNGCGLQAFVKEETEFYALFSKDKKSMHAYETEILEVIHRVGIRRIRRQERVRVIVKLALQASIAALITLGSIWAWNRMIDNYPTWAGQTRAEIMANVRTRLRSERLTDFLSKEEAAVIKQRVAEQQRNALIPGLEEALDVWADRIVDEVYRDIDTECSKYSVFRSIDECSSLIPYSRAQVRAAARKTLDYRKHELLDFLQEQGIGNHDDSWMGWLAEHGFSPRSTGKSEQSINETVMHTLEPEFAKFHDKEIRPRIQGMIHEAANQIRTAIEQAPEVVLNKLFGNATIVQGVLFAIPVLGILGWLSEHVITYLLRFRRRKRDYIDGAKNTVRIAK